MQTSFYRLVLLVLALCICIRAQGQVAAAGTTGAGSNTTTSVEQVPRVPGLSSLLRGFNAGFTFSQAHDSAAGWYNVATPAIGYTISRHYSVDASVSIYPYRRVQSQSAPPSSSKDLVVDLGQVGDTLIGLHTIFNPRIFRNTTTASFTIPTGDRSTGLGTGRVTFDFSDHMEHYVKQTGFVLDLGTGDSSGLFNRLVTNENDSLGALAHFQAGVVVYFWGSDHIQSVAYEELPYGHQTLYTTVSPPGAPPAQVVSGSGVGEDNGFTTSIGIPLTDHLAIGGYYNRSLRQHLDTVSVGVTYVLRGTPRRKRLSLIDRALREAEGDNKD